MANNTLYRTITDWFIEKVRHPKAMWVFEKLVYLWLLIFGLVMYPIKDLLFGPDSMMFGVRLDDGLINNFFLKIVYVKSLGSTVYFIHLGAVIWALFGVPKAIHFLPKIIVFITAWMFYYAAPSMFNAGYLLIIAYSFFLIFARPTSQSTFWVILTNLSYVAIIVQLMVVYTTAALLKWQGQNWLDGSAVWLVAHYNTYQNDTMVNLLSKNHWLAIFLNFAALFYQTLFPIIVWFNRFKNYILIIGLLFHLYTVFVMGLYFFGIAMILGYLMFLDENSKVIHFFWKKRVGNFS